MRRAQGSLEYLLILAAILAIAVVVVLILTNLLIPAEVASVIGEDRYRAALSGVEIIGYDQIYDPDDQSTAPETIVYDGEDYDVVQGDTSGLGDPITTITGSDGNDYGIYVGENEAIIGEICTDECTTDGDIRCHGTGSDTCTDHDGNGCLEWEFADTGCDDGYDCLGGVCTPDPEIYSWADLDRIRFGLDGDYILMGDLDAGTAGYDTYASATANENLGWLPIGTVSDPFTGTLDGNGYTITGLNINRPGTDDVGLFSETSSSSEIIGICLAEVDIVGANSVGGLVGETNAGTISDSHVNGTVSGAAYVGGLVSHNTGIITNSYTTGVVSGNSRVGGLVGHNFGPITDSHATGTVTGTSMVGGLVAFHVVDIIANSYATGTVTGTSEFVGGLVGINNGGIIIDAYATGAASGTDQVGGLVGRNFGPITNSYATGAVSGTSEVGGLVGWNDASATTTNSYWDKDTTLQSTSAGPETEFTTLEMTYDPVDPGMSYDGRDVPNDAAGPYYTWDFTVTGDWDHNTTGGYPVLR